MENPMVEAWSANQAANMRLLGLLQDEQLGWRYGPRVRTLRQVFTHLHHRRLAWLAVWGELAEPLERIRRTDPETTFFLSEQLGHSADALGHWFEKGWAEALVPGFGKSPFTFCCFLIAHEAHHRGQVVTTLRLKGQALSADQIHSLWEWGGEED